MIETRSASTALNKHKCLQRFLKFLLGEDEISRSPMERVPQPKTLRNLIPVMPEQDARSLLDALKGKGFAGLRDEAIIRVFANTGA